MIISKTPFRVSLFGGSTDYSQFYSRHQSLLVGFTLDKYCYITFRKTPSIFNYKTKASYSRIEEVNSNKDIEHPGIRGALSYYKIQDGVEITHVSDLPSQTGIGSSSSFAVGLCHCIEKYLDPEYQPSPASLANSAIEIERHVLKEAGGIQDQIFAAYGGFSSIHIDRDGTFQVKPLPVSEEFINEFLSRSVLVYTGNSRGSFELAKSHNKKVDDKLGIKTLAEYGYKAFSDGNIDEIGNLLGQSWREKKKLNDAISSSEINTIYDNMMSHGMIGGKLLGAGGSGFIFGICEDHSSANRIRKKFNSVEFSYSKRGSEIINVS